MINAADGVVRVSWSEADGSNNYYTIERSPAGTDGLVPARLGRRRRDQLGRPQRRI